MANIEDLSGVIERTFASLPTDAGFKVADLPQEANGRPILLGRDSLGSRLLVPCGRDEHRYIKSDEKSSALHLLCTPLEEGGRRVYYLDLVCLRPDLIWLFSGFVAHTLLQLETRPTASPVETARGCFLAWRELFRIGGARRLSLRQLAGLFGELTVLERVLAVRAGAIDAWKGPLREPHDFVGSTADVEVKTTLLSEDPVVDINGIDQLAEAGGRDLFLAHFHVDVPADEGETVPELVGRLRELDVHGHLQSLLNAAGYNESDADAYGGLSFAVHGEEWFAVGADFPRLLSTTFPDGQVPIALGDFRYTLDLSAVPQHSLGPAVAAAVVERVAS